MDQICASNNELVHCIIAGYGEKEKNRSNSGNPRGINIFVHHFCLLWDKIARPRKTPLGLFYRLYK